MKKRILIVSHERSGTHFLLNSIGLNFNRPFQPTSIGKELSGGPLTEERFTQEEMRDFLDSSRFSQVQKGKSLPDQMLKSHHDVDFHGLSKDILKEKYYVFYIYRDCKDVLTSMYYYFNLHKEVYPWTEDVSDFCLTLKFKNDEYLSQGYNNFVERWKIHTDGWLASEIPDKTISYEELSFHFNDVIREIGETIEETPGNHLQEVVRPKLGEFVHSYPRKGIVGDWENLMSEEVANKIDSLICV